jgi:hypothetical protein
VLSICLCYCWISSKQKSFGRAFFAFERTKQSKEKSFWILREQSEELLHFREQQKQKELCPELRI